MVAWPLALALLSLPQEVHSQASDPDLLIDGATVVRLGVHQFPNQGPVWLMVSGGTGPCAPASGALTEIRLVPGVDEALADRFLSVALTAYAAKKKVKIRKSSSVSFGCTNASSIEITH